MTRREAPPAVEGEDLNMYKSLLREIQPDAKDKVLTAAARMLAVTEKKTGILPGQPEAQDALTKADEALADDAIAQPAVFADGIYVGKKGDVDTEDLRKAA